MQAAGCSNRASTVVLAVCLVALSAVLFTGPIADIDFWWHISNGRWIVENRALPETDPFGVYPTVNHWARTILQGQWAGQVALFLAYDGLGAMGVKLLRFAVLGLTLAIVAVRVWRTDSTIAARALALVICAVMLWGFSADRPQLFSLLFFTALIALLEAGEARKRLRLAVLPLLVLWTNVHQGVLLGAVIAALWLGMLAWRERRAEPREARLSAVLALLSLASPIATPNGFRGIEYLVWLEFEPAKQRISEYASPLSYLGQTMDIPQILVFFTFALALLAVLATTVRRIDLRWALAALLLVVGFSGYRYLAFVVLMAAPLAAAEWTRLARSHMAWKAIGTALVAATAFAVFKVGAIQSQGFSAQLAPGKFPVELAKTAHELGASGRMFTTVGWGGYLGWEFAGTAQPFIDGRYLMNTQRLDDYTHILWATPRGMQLLRNSDIRWVLMPHRNPLTPLDRPYPLPLVLGQDPQWQVRQSNEQGVLISRR